LDAAAQLIDAMFVTSPEQRPRRLSAIDFPATLEWLRKEDVVRLARDGGRGGVSRKSFDNRWESKEDFVNDAVIHTMLYRDAPNANPSLQLADMASLADSADLGQAIARFCDAMLESLLSYPRSFLLLHIGPLLEQHPQLKAAIVSDMLRALAPWYEGYAQLFAAFGVSMRPGWTIERYGLAIQSMLDGFLLRSRVQAEQMDACRFEDASLFADAVVAFTLGVIDTGGSSGGLSSRAALNVGVDKGTQNAP
jgi:AcrR family transcriptional regulator